MPVSAYTRLEAVNFMLGTIGEAPVDTLTGTGLADVETAQRLLDIKNRQVQAIGWHWNLEYRLPISPDINGYINMPANTLKMDVNDPDAIDDEDRRPYDIVLRGQRAYNVRHHTFVFNKVIKFDVVKGLDFQFIPQSTRDYIVISAARLFQTHVIGSQILDELSRQEEQQAWVAMWQEQLDSADHGMLNWEDGYHMKRILRR